MEQQTIQRDVMRDGEPIPTSSAGAEQPSRRRRGMRVIARLAGAAVVGGLLYGFVVRPWHLRWGTTEEEAHAALPGDDLLNGTQMESTRGITIDAPASEIWPWLVQMGQGRGGLYSYDWLENVVGCDIHSADAIIPGYQRLEVGDTIHLGPEGYPFFTVASIVPERALVLGAGLDERSSAPSQPGTPPEHKPGATWAFLLRPLDAKRTRLLIRLRGDWESTAMMTLLNRIIIEPAHFVMERKMIYGIKERAENMR